MRFKRILCMLALLALVVTALPVADLSARADARYYIVVDTTNQIVTVYDNGNTTDAGIARQMICTTGAKATPTPAGTYTLPSKTYATERTEWYYFSQYNCYAKWATRIVGGVLFHSVLFSASKKGPTKASTKALGSKGSHGCVRLRVEDAHWIAVNCPAGTKCKIYASGATNKDLRKRLLSKTFSRDAETYDHYMGRPDGTSATMAATVNLSKGKKGPLVTELQNRLRGLGFFTGAVDGKFGKTTKTAVCAFQQAIGLKKTGKVNTALWNAIFSAAAPTATLATLAEGVQGPAVAVLQQALKDLKLFSGAADGNFGADTTAAVGLYQQDFNLPVNGLADPDLQKAAIQKAAEVKARFGDAAYQLVATSQPVTLALVKAKSTVKMRNKPSNKGKAVTKLKKNWQVKVLADLNGWMQVQYGSYVGYVPSKNLNCFAGTEVTVSYVPAATPAPDPTPSLPGVAAAPLPEAEAAEGDGLVLEEATPEPTPEPAAEPTPEPTPEPEVETVEEVAEEPVAEPAGEVAEEPEAEPVEAPVAETAEAPVAEEPAEPVAEETEVPVAEAPAFEEAPLMKYAVVLSEGAKLFADANAEAEPLALLPLGLALETARADGTWIVVRFNGAEAWIAAADVALTDALAEAEPEPEAEIEYGDEAAEPIEQPDELPEDGLILEEGPET